MSRKPGQYQGGVGAEASRGEVVEPDTVFEVADGVFDDGVAAVVGFECDGVAVAVGDQGVVGVVDEQGELGSGGGTDASHDEAQQRRFFPNGR